MERGAREELGWEGWARHCQRAPQPAEAEAPISIAPVLQMMALWSLKKPDVVLISLLEVAQGSGVLPADLPTSKYFVSCGNFEKNFFLGTPPAAAGRDQGFRGPCQGILQFPVVLANSLRRASVAPVGLGSTPRLARLAKLFKGISH